MSENEKKPAELWRCDKCGCEYVRDIGRCGSRIPLCDGFVFRADPRSEGRRLRGLRDRPTN